MNNRRTIPLLWIAAALLAFCAYGCGTKTRISKKARSSTAQILTDRIFPEFVGTGFVVGEGLIAVDYRLVSNLQRPYSRLAGDDHVHSVESIAAIDDERNLAILRVSTHDAPALPLGEIGALQAGDPLYAAEIGEKGKIKVSKAEFSKTRTGPRGETMIEAPALPLDIVGAPVFNKQGEAVGIASQAFLDGELKSYAVPSSALKPLIERAMGRGVRAEEPPLTKKYNAVSQWNLPEGAAARFGKGYARHIAISPDGKTLASSGGAGVWLHDAETGKETALLRTDAYEMRSAAFSPDGSSIAAVGQKGWGSLIWIWDVRTGKKLLTLKDNTARREYSDDHVIYSPDGAVIASAGHASFQRYVRLWDARTGALINKLKSSERSMNGRITPMAIAFSPDGTILASGMRNNGIELWDVQKAQLLHTLKGHVDQVESMEFSPDGRTLASVGDSKDNSAIRIWDVDAKSFLFSIEEKRMRVNAFAYSPNGQFIATGGGEKVRIWDAFTGRLLLKIEAGQGNVIDVAYFPDGNKLASLSNGLIHIWDVWTGKKLRTIRGYASGFYSQVCAVAYSPNGQTIASAESSAVKVWDAHTGALLRKFIDASRVITWQVNTIAYSPDGQTIAGGAYNAQIWDMKTGALLHLLEGHKERVKTVAYSPDGQYLISGSEDKTARIWDARAGTHLHTLKGHAHIVSGAAFSPDGKNAATVSSGTLRIWDVRTGTVLKTVNPQQGSLRSVAYSPDQKTIAVGTFGQVVALLDASTGALLQTYQLEGKTDWGDYNGITSLAFDPDGHTLAASFHQTIWLWDIETGELQNEIKGHGKIVMGAAFSSDGQRLLSGSLDGSMLLWDLNSVSSRP